MFKVTITEIVETRRPETKYERVSDTGNDKDDGPVYEFVPTGREEIKVTTQPIYEQVVNNLNVEAVILAVNNRLL